MSSQKWVVKIFYGPYFSHGLFRHQYFRQRGLISALEDEHFIVETSPTNLLNRVSIEMCEKTVFTCDITNLKFNMDIQDDPVCRRAVDTLLDARTSSEANRNLDKAQSQISLFGKFEEDKISDEENTNIDEQSLENIIPNQEHLYHADLYPTLAIGSHTTIVSKYL